MKNKTWPRLASRAGWAFLFLGLLLQVVALTIGPDRLLAVTALLFFVGGVLVGTSLGAEIESIEREQQTNDRKELQ